MRKRQRDLSITIPVCLIIGVLAILCFAGCSSPPGATETTSASESTQTEERTEETVTTSAVGRTRFERHRPIALEHVRKFTLLDDGPADDEENLKGLAPDSIQIIEHIVELDEALDSHTTVNWGDQDSLLYKVCETGKAQPFLRAIYEQRFGGEDKKLLLDMQEPQYLLNSAVKHGEFYYITGFRWGVDAEGDWTFYLSKLVDGRLQHLIELKSDSFWKFPTRLYCDGSRGYALFQRDAESPVQRLIVDFETDECTLTAIAPDVKGDLVRGAKNVNSGASIFEIYNKETQTGAAIYAVGDRVHRIEGDPAIWQSYGLIGDYLIQTNYDKAALKGDISIYDTELNLVAQIDNPGVIWTLSNLGEAITLFRSGASRGLIYPTEEGDFELGHFPTNDVVVIGSYGYKSLFIGGELCFDSRSDIHRTAEDPLTYRCFHVTWD
ncbi:MAG: hypothetical protein Q4A52_00540 [Bacillota bacterium]|nr:hypothetical protein [Bacillota bacterium]